MSSEGAPRAKEIASEAATAITLAPDGAPPLKEVSSARRSVFILGGRMPGYTVKNLRDVEDAAAHGGFSETQEARFPLRDLGVEQTGVSLHLVRPGKRQAFAHRH